MADEIDLVFREGSLEDLQAANYALSSLSSIPEFQDMLAIASSEQRLTIELRGYGFGGTAANSHFVRLAATRPANCTQEAD